MKQTPFMAMSLFMILLVMSIPYVSAANSITVARASGSDNVNGIRRDKDQITVEATVRVTDGPTDNLQEHLVIRQGPFGSTQFDSCTGSANTFTCLFQEAAANSRFGLLEYSLTLFPGEANSVFAKTQVAVDTTPPRVQSVQADKTAVSSGNINLQYAVQDTACPTCGNRCAGLKSVDVYVVESNTKVQTFGVTDNACTITNTHSVDISSLPNGITHLCVVPTDRFNQVSGDYLSSTGPVIGSNCVAMKKDNSKPEIVFAELRYGNARGVVDYVSNRGNTLTMEVEVKTKVFDLNGNRIWADLTPLGLAPAFLACTEAFTNDFFCEHTFKALITESGSKQIKIKAEDEMGNVQEQTFSFALQVDDDIPVVKELRTLYPYAKGNKTGSVLGPKNNTLIAEIQEEGSGFDRQQVFFTIAGNRLHAQCEGTRCQYAGYDLASFPQQLTVSVGGMDDVEHTFSHQETFAVDTEKPTFINASLINTNLRPYLVQGDSILLRASFKDNYGISEDSTADFSAFSDDYEAHPVCEEEHGIFVCEWQVFSVLPTEQVTASFMMLDAGHNPLSFKLHQFPVLFEQDGQLFSLPEGAVNVAQLGNGTIDFVTVQPGTPMPDFVDADTARVTSFRFWWPIGFKARGNAKIVDLVFNPNTCTGEDANLLEDVDFVAPEVTDFTKFFIKFTLQQGTIEKEALKLSCEVETVSKQGNTVYPAEVDQIHLTIPVLRVGEVSQAVVDEIDDVRHSWLVEAEFIGTLNKWIQMAKNICNFIYTIENLMNAIRGLNHALGTIDKTPWGAPIAVPVEASNEKIHIMEKKMFKWMSPICKWVSCRTGWQKYYQQWNQKITNALLPGEHDVQAPGPVPRPFDPKHLEVAAWPSDPSQSLILSVVSFCIPGILYNLQKAREIECSYLECLAEEVPSGTPSFVCSRMRNYGWCRYVWGEIFQVLPFANFLHDMVGTISRLLSNPLSAFLGISNFICTKFVGEGHSLAFCEGISDVVTYADIVQDLHAIFKTDWKLQKDACKETLQRVDEKLDSGFRETPGEEPPVIGEVPDEETPANQPPPRPGTEVGAG